MSHRIIINENGTGPAGTAEIEIAYTPSHDLTPAEQMRRVEKATRIAKKALDALYEAEPAPE